MSEDDSVTSTTDSLLQEVLHDLFSSDEPKLDEHLDTSYEDLLDLYPVSNPLLSPKKKRMRTGTHDDRDLRPLTFVKLNTRRGKPKPVTIRALLDSGGSESLIDEQFCKKLNVKTCNQSSTVWSTPAGKMTTNRTVKAKFILPELHDDRCLEWKFHVTKKLGDCDMILGRDFLEITGIDILFSSKTVVWDEHETSFKPHDANSEDHYHIEEPDVVLQASERVKRILDAKYQKADLDSIVEEHSHLSTEEREMLLILLKRYGSLFDGTLGLWKGTEIDLELLPDVKPYHARPYPVPRCHEATVKQEVERLCKIGVLKRVNRSEWAAPSFIIPKKDGTVRFISDFRELNKRIRRKPYPIPNIQDMLLNLEGFQCATSLDLNMGHYHIELSPFSKRLCTIVFPFGKYEYQRIPMGLSYSPDYFQEKMSELMQDLEYVRTYLDDLLVLTKGSFTDHLEKLERVLERPQEAGLKVNAKKSFFGRAELDSHAHRRQPSWSII